MIEFHDEAWWARRADDVPGFIIDGLVHADATGVSGRPKAGKTVLVSAMAAAIARGDNEFMGRKVNAHGPIMIVATDPGEAKKWGKRGRGYGVRGSFIIGQYSGQDDWQRVMVAVADYRPALFIYDNLLGGLDGQSDINSSEDASAQLHHLNQVLMLDVPVLAIGHSSKTGFEGSEPKGFMGSTAYQAWPRHVLHVSKVRDDSLRISVEGNETPTHSFSVDVEFDSSSLTARYDGVPDSTRTSARPRAGETRKQRVSLFDEVRADPLLSVIESSRKLGAKLHEQNPAKYGSADAARMAFQRAKKAASGVFVDGRWSAPGKTVKEMETA